jgi:hypothetical protein
MIWKRAIGAPAGAPTSASVGCYVRNIEHIVETDADPYRFHRIALRIHAVGCNARVLLLRIIVGVFESGIAVQNGFENIEFIVGPPRTVRQKMHWVAIVKEWPWRATDHIGVDNAGAGTTCHLVVALVFQRHAAPIHQFLRVGGTLFDHTTELARDVITTDTEIDGMLR